MDQPRRLYRSRRNKWIAGVCGGIGEYLNIDPLVIRILAIVIPGFGWLAYLICAILIPSE
jgi:phage shock protein PspC (stress-responsive transcriptional regulator)